MAWSMSRSMIFMLALGVKTARTFKLTSRSAFRPSVHAWAAKSSLTRVADLDKATLVVDHPNNNVSPIIVERVGRNLHLIPNHPLNIIKRKIEAYFASREGKTGKVFEVFDDLAPVVTLKSNFDDLLIPKDHVSRSPSDTYYISDDLMLRAHTSAHQSSLLKEGHSNFLCTGDVYRRDEIDASHYPVFHQMEGVCVFPELTPPAGSAPSQGNEVVAADLKATLEGLCDALFGPVEKRWGVDNFPFTTPSFELEIFYNGDWLEVLGCGVMRQEILRDAGRGESPGWAFGLGLERLAMVLFDIPDIRLFWSSDRRFLEQFSDGKITKFKPFSKFPACYKDVSFWLGDVAFHPNDLAELVRGVAGDEIEEIKLIDEFTHPKTSRQSKTFRLNYRSMENSLTNEAVNVMQEKVRGLLQEKFHVELR